MGGFALLATLGQPASPVQAAGSAEVFAGTGTAGPATGDGGPAADAALDHPTGVAFAADGTVYLSDGGNHRVRAVSPAGVISTVAGTGRAGVPGSAVPDGTAATGVDLSLPGNLAVGPDGTLYVADSGLGRVFAVTPDGRLSVLAGTGRPGPAGDGGPATGAALGRLGGLAISPDGTVYIGDLAGHRVRAVTRDGTISTVAGNGNQQVTRAGGPATEVAVASPDSIAVGADGTLWIASGLLVHRLAGGTLSTITRPGTGGGDRWVAADGADWPPADPPVNNVAAVAAAGSDVYLLDQRERVLLRLRPGGAFDRATGLDGVTPPLAGPIAATGQGIAYVVDNAGHRIYRVGLDPAPETPDDADPSLPWWPFALVAVGVLVVTGWLVTRRRRTH